MKGAGTVLYTHLEAQVVSMGEAGAVLNEASFYTHLEAKVVSMGEAGAVLNEASLIKLSGNKCPMQG